jgi:ubiquinone/menaquinone biosynthesis C-methylase UbiE
MGFRCLLLTLPLPARWKVRIYYTVFTHFFNILCEGKGIFNYGQEPLCRDTAETLPRPGKWLDVGCGVGGPALLLAKENPDVTIVGLNIALHQVHMAREKCDEAGLSGRIEFVPGDASGMPFEGENLFDGLYAIETAFHFPDKPGFAREAHRVLKPGARFAMADMVRKDRDHSRGQRLFGRLFHGWLGVLRMTTVSGWREELEKAGFSEFESKDVSATVLRNGLALANSQVRKQDLILKTRFPRWVIRAIYWGNDVILRDIEGQPIRYVLITAKA